MRRPAYRMARRLGAPALALLTLWGCAKLQAGLWPGTPRADPTSQSLARRMVEFREISFELPGSDWQRDETEKSKLDIRRGTPGHQPQSIAIWSVGVPPSLRNSSVHDHASRYFDEARRLPRFEGRWEGFVQGHRAIAGRLYPVMTVRVTYPSREIVADSLFLLYFPDDFSERQRFYVLMWLDFHPENERARPVDELDALVSSFRLKPLNR